MTTGSLAAQPGEVELSATARDLKPGINTVMIEPDLQRWDGQGWTTVAGLAPLDYRADRPPARWWVPVDQGRYRWTSTAFDPLDVTQRSAPAAWHYFTVDRTGPMLALLFGRSRRPRARRCTPRTRCPQAASA